MATLGSAALENRAPRLRLHTFSETMLAKPLDSTRLKRPLHSCGSPAFSVRPKPSGAIVSERSDRISSRFSGSAVAYPPPKLPVNARPAPNPRSPRESSLGAPLARRSAFATLGDPNASPRVILAIESRLLSRRRPGRTTGSPSRYHGASSRQPRWTPLGTTIRPKTIRPEKSTVPSRSNSIRSLLCRVEVRRRIR